MVLPSGATDVDHHRRNASEGRAMAAFAAEGLSLKDFAEKAGITLNNAAVRVHRAREALRKRLVSTCSSCAALGCTDCTRGTPGEAS